MAYDISELTSGCPQDTSGVFEQLLSSVMKHVQNEYDNQRIRGSEYSQVYLGALQSTMQQSIQYLLGIEIAKNQALLIEKQIEGQEKQNLLLEEQRLLLIAQTALVNEQVNTQVKQTGLVEQQELNLEAEALNIPKQGVLIDNQASKVLTDQSLVTQQVLTETENTDIAAYQVSTILPAQKDKLDSEIAILDQKKVTEEAQTKTSTSQGTVEGILGKQMDLYTNQAEGFIRDSEQKASRILADLWGILASTTDLDAGAIPTEISQSEMDTMLRNLKINAGLEDNLP